MKTRSLLNTKTITAQKLLADIEEKLRVYTAVKEAIEQLLAEHLPPAVRHVRVYKFNAATRARMRAGQQARHAKKAAALRASFEERRKPKTKKRKKFSWSPEARARISKQRKAWYARARDAQDAQAVAQASNKQHWEAPVEVPGQEH
jgi:hypothetical protein